MSWITTLLKASSDTFAQQSTPGTNYGNQTFLRVSNNGSNHVYSYVKFDVDKSKMVHASIQSATL